MFYVLRKGVTWKVSFSGNGSRVPTSTSFLTHTLTHSFGAFVGGPLCRLSCCSLSLGRNLLWRVVNISLAVLRISFHICYECICYSAAHFQQGVSHAIWPKVSCLARAVSFCCLPLFVCLYRSRRCLFVSSCVLVWPVVCGRVNGLGVVVKLLQWVFSKSTSRSWKSVGAGAVPFAQMINGIGEWVQMQEGLGVVQRDWIKGKQYFMVTQVSSKFLQEYSIWSI